jgi:hypothetical protein
MSTLLAPKISKWKKSSEKTGQNRFFYLCFIGVLQQEETYKEGINISLD